jgi:hypothetical protein
MRPYAAEYRRLVQLHFDVLHAENLAAAAGSSSSSSSPTVAAVTSPTIFSMSMATRRRAMAESLFRSANLKRAGGAGASGFGNNMGVYPGLLSIAGVGSPTSSGAQRDSEPSVSMESDTLELAGTMQLLLPDISMVGVRARKLQLLQQRALSAAAATSASQNAPVDANIMRRGSIPGNKIKPTCQPVVLNTRRDSCGGLICTQAEILSHVWLPLLLHSDVDFEYIASALCVFIAHLRESNLPVTPAFSAVLLNVLFHSSRFVEVSRMLQQRAVPDSIELALYSLEFCDMLEDHIENAQVESQTQSGGFGEPIDSEASTAPAAAGLETRIEGALVAHDQIRRYRSALGVMRQCALDVLWRLDERVTVVKWHLNHGEVLRAMSFCKKKAGHWLGPLVPGSIPGADFFAAAVSAVSLLQGVPVVSGSHKGTPQKDPRPPSRHGVASPDETLSSSDDQCDPKEIRRAKDKKASINGAAISLFYAVYLFLREWDNAILLTTLVRYCQN